MAKNKMIINKKSLSACLAAIILFTAAGLAERDKSSSAKSGVRAPSKYGILTSSRWAYQAEYKKENLKPVKNNNPYPEPQPRRDHPKELAISPDGKKLYVTLTGNELNPGNEVAVFDIQTKKTVKRIKVGSSPYHLDFHPKGRFIVVINRFSNYASVIDSSLDKVVSEIPLDFYSQYIAFNKAGTVAYVSNRYLNQVFIVDIKATDDALTGKMRLLGGFDEKTFAAGDKWRDGPLRTIQKSCGDIQCHGQTRGGFYAGKNSLKTFFSVIERSVPGDAEESPLLRATLSKKEGGFADDLAGNNFHAGGQKIFGKKDAEYRAIADWINSARPGPGIPVGNFGSKPYSLYLDRAEKYLYVGNLGTQDISIIDLEKEREVTGIYTQNVITSLGCYYDRRNKEELLIALSMGIGFGAAKERDPFGGETEDPGHQAAQFTVIRDVNTTEPLPMAKQKILGAFDAIDGTAASKMSDIQNDIIVVNLKKLSVPPPTRNGQLMYALRANRYEAHRQWTRYTSDSAEILPYDTAGDIPPALQRVPGAFPESLAIYKDRLFVAMLGTYELAEWKINSSPEEPSDYLEPLAVYKTGIMPRDVVVGQDDSPAEGLVFVSNFLGETVSVINVKTGVSKEYPVGDLSRPVPDTNAERGEMFVNTSVFSVDHDTSCMHCHIYGASDARGWGAGQAIAQMKDGKFVNGGLLAIPQMKNLFATQPFYFEGTHTAFDAQFDDAREHVALQGFLTPNPHGDFTDVVFPVPEDERKKEHEEIQDKMSTDQWGTIYHDLMERRDEHIRRLSMQYFGKAFNFRDFQRFIGEFQVVETRLMPNPFDKMNPSVERGKLLYNNLGVGCVVCHKPPEFTNKETELYHNREMTLPSIISFTRREKSFTLVGPHWMDSVNNHKRDLEYWETGRVERKEGNVTSFQLRGLFDRPFAFLHHGRARSIRETIAVPGHYSLRKYKYSPLKGGEEMRKDGRERGFNELTFIEERAFMVDTHGGTSHLNATQIQDLENFLLSIE